MKARKRITSIVVISLLFICAVAFLLLLLPVTSSGQKGFQIRWTGKLSLIVESQTSLRNGEEVERVTRYNFGPIQVQTNKRR